MEDCRPTAGFQPRLGAVLCGLTYVRRRHALETKSMQAFGFAFPMCLVCVLGVPVVPGAPGALGTSAVRTEPPGVAGVTQAPWYICGGRL